MDGVTPNGCGWCYELNGAFAWLLGSLPQLEGELSVTGIAAPVTVRRDRLLVSGTPLLKLKNGRLPPGALRDGTPEDYVRDFLAGMTDAFAVNLFEKIFSPRRWWVL